MQSADEAGPGPIPWWRFLLITAMASGLYFAGRFIVTPPQTNPALLLLTILLGAGVGVLVAKLETTADDRRGHRGPNRGHRRTVSEARWYVLGLAGGGLALAQVLPPTTLEWLALGLTALPTGAASHAWMTERRSREARAS